VAQYTPQWQVVFKIKNDDGVVRDYCREQPPLVSLDDDPWFREMTRGEVVAWAEKTIVTHKLHSYDIQYW
jgi:hypothetical protein